jgi:NAD(P)-dependent dehydrogenase (short-subunit alcohol dehydrogenase family)
MAERRALTKMSKILEGKVALVTGGAGAIGRAVGKGFLKTGAKICLVDINRRRLKEFESELTASFGGDRILAVAADVRQTNQVQRAFQAAMKEFGRLDILVNNAAVTQIKTIDALTDEDIDLIIDTNLKGYIKCAREAVGIMKRQGQGGSLLFMSSKNGIVAASEKCLYSATKGGELTLARSLAMELGKFGIRVNTICPDAVIEGSALWEEGGAYRLGTAKRYNIPLEEIPNYYKNRCALKVTITAEDIANAAIFLVSPLAAKITGQILPVDGGVAYVR